MISYGANLGLMVNAATGEVHDVALRGFLRGVDGLVQPNVKGYLTNTPPGSPSDGDVYIIGAAPTGAWAGNAGKVARWSANDGAWDFYTPKNGWMVQSNSAREVYRYTGGAWEIFYQEGTWTTVPSNLTVVGTPTYGAQFIKTGSVVNIWMSIYSTTSTSATTGVTSFTLPFNAHKESTAYVVNANGTVDIGPCLITGGFVFMPGWAPSSGPMIFGAAYKI